MSPIASSVHLKPEFHLNPRMLKLINLDKVERVNVHENGVALITRGVDGSISDVNLDWDQAEQLYLALANALTLRNIKAMDVPKA